MTGVKLFLVNICNLNEIILIKRNIGSYFLKYLMSMKTSHTTERIFLVNDIINNLQLLIFHHDNYNFKTRPKIKKYIFSKD